MPVRLLIPMVALVTLGLGSEASRAEEAPARPRQPKLEFVYLSVKQVPTDEAAVAAQRQVQAVPGVRSFEWTVARQEAKIIRVVGQASTAMLVAAFAEGGAQATALQVTQSILMFRSRLHCNSCVIKVKRALKPLKGMKETQVARDLTAVTVVYDSSQSTLEQIRETLDGAGYPVR